MAGGKETPRQKMIGMMYLVLTALLALNVSKSILDAFVAIEENMQKANLTELFRGDEKRGELAETASDKSNPQRAIKAQMLLDQVVEDIDKMTADMINDELLCHLKGANLAVFTHEISGFYTKQAHTVVTDLNLE